MYIANARIRSENILYQKGDVLEANFPDEEIIRLIKAKAVTKIADTAKHLKKSRPPDNYCGHLNSCEDELVLGEEDELVLGEEYYLNERELQKMPKAELSKYGESIGCEVSEELKKEEMINILLKFTEGGNESDGE